MLGVEISYLSVLLGAIGSMAVGMFWYSEKGFGKQWMKLIGMSKKKLEEAQKKGMAKTMTLAFGAQLVTAFVLAHAIAYFGAMSWLAGAEVAFWMWFGFIATKSLSVVLWENKPKELYFLNMGHELVALLVMGAIIGLF